MTEWTFSEAVIDKARGYLADGQVTRDKDAPGMFWVQGSERRRYRVQTDADPVKGTATWINCTCAWGLHQGAGRSACSHAVAALLLVRAEHEGRLDLA